MNLVIISASVRTGRQSHRAALFLQRMIEEHGMHRSEILDLMEYNFPMFEERLVYQTDPAIRSKEFSEKISGSDAVIIVTPEYNGGYPASLKNAIDLLTGEWKRKPVAICTVSAGSFGGSQVLISLQFTLWKMKALTIPVMFPIPEIGKVFDENGQPTDKALTEKRANAFLNEIFWYAERMKG